MGVRAPLPLQSATEPAGFGVSYGRRASFVVWAALMPLSVRAVQPRTWPLRTDSLSKARGFQGSRTDCCWTGALRTRRRTAKPLPGTHLQSMLSGAAATSSSVALCLTTESIPAHEKELWKAPWTNQGPRIISTSSTESRINAA